jgi:hypothetical protein
VSCFRGCKAGDAQQVRFAGPATSAKQECILIFDAERKTFVLERLTKSVKLKVESQPSGGGKRSVQSTEATTAVVPDNNQTNPAKRRREEPTTVSVTSHTPSAVLNAEVEPAEVQRTTPSLADAGLVLSDSESGSASSEDDDAN